jgi:hypothetical protein
VLISAGDRIMEPHRRAPENLNTALGIMFETRLLAQDVLATPDPNGQPTGLCFEYVSTSR